MAANSDKVIAAGDIIPDIQLHTMGENGPEEISTLTFCRGRKIVLFAVPGAFTPTCSESHLPGFVENTNKLLAKGVDAIACISVNDVFVMDAWGRSRDAGSIVMLADGLGSFARAVGMTLDFTARGFGIRSDRYAMIIDDTRVSWVAREQPKTLDVSTAEAVLVALD